MLSLYTNENCWTFLGSLHVLGPAMFNVLVTELSENSADLAVRLTTMKMIVT